MHIHPRNNTISASQTKIGVTKAVVERPLPERKVAGLSLGRVITETFYLAQF